MEKTKSPINKLIDTLKRICVMAVLLVIVTLLVVTFFFQGFWVSEDRVTEAVTDEGYMNIVIKDKDITFIKMRGCSSDDDAAYEVSAKNKDGKDVDLLVCAGWPFRGTTVRHP